MDREITLRLMTEAAGIRRALTSHRTRLARAETARDALIVRMYRDESWSIRDLSTYWDRSKERIGAALVAHEIASGTRVVRDVGTRPGLRA